jgi:death-on-curing protein
MTEPFWLTPGVVADVHSEQLALFGGPDGIRDQGLLESALARPINRFAYGETDMAALAAAYAFGIAKNHPFIDGNKRVSLLALIIFLRLNGIEFTPSEADAAAIILALAAGEVEEEGLTRWICDNWPKNAPA